MNYLIYSILGGDNRQKECAKILADKGNIVKVYGILDKFDKNITIFNKLDKNFFECDVLMLPIPYKNNDGHINHVIGAKKLALIDFAFYILPTSLVVLGKADDEIDKISKVCGFKYFDLLGDETFAVLNSIPSAEGAIQRAMENTDITIHGSDILVLGYGRLGKTLARMLKGIGAHVTVAARKDHDLAWITENGYIGVHLNNLNDVIGRQDIIFNTIPALIIGSNELYKVKKDVLIIDLASYPGGVDFKTANKLNIQATLELSLPGIVAPKTAANIICMRIQDLMN